MAGRKECLFIGHRRVAALLGFLCAIVVACSINPTRGGEVGVYQMPDEGATNGADNGRAFGESVGGTQVPTRVEDAGDGRPDARQDAQQDSGRCIGESYALESEASKPIAVYVVADTTNTLNTRVTPLWSESLLEMILSSPESWGIGSLGFKLIGPDSRCDSRFDEPTSPIASLSVPENLLALRTAAFSAAMTLTPIAAIALHPILPALKGAIEYARSYAQLNQDTEVEVWLITDGLPDGCDSTVENAAQTAADALSAPIPITTYVFGVTAIGVGELQRLDPIAQSGGTDKTTLVDLAGKITDFGIVTLATGAAEAMNAASLAFLNSESAQRRSASPCEYALPAADQSEQVALDLINIYFTPNGGQKTPVYRVADANSCDPVKGGWFYNATDTGFITCDKTCDIFKTTPGEVSAELGCPTLVLEPK